MKENTFLGACQNSPFNEIILATTIFVARMDF